MKTEYDTIEFRPENQDWRCTDQEGDVLGDIVQNKNTRQYRFLSLGSVFLCGETCHKIADFLDQLNKAGKT